MGKIEEEKIEKQRATLSDYSSKIKRIYLELHGYTFFHGPSEIDNIDSRFIGRKRLIDRLTNLLTNDESKSGAYLVTGFKGMGKTSLVSKVIADVTAAVGSNFVLARYFRIMLLLLFLPLVDLDPLTITINSILIIICAICLFIIDLNKKNLKRGKRKGWIYIKSIFTISKEEISKFKAKTFFQDIFLVSLIRLLGILVRPYCSKLYDASFSTDPLSVEPTHKLSFQL
ncbi:MAG: ATP-binding protein [Nitrospirae bacterium]|nr:ATP-binding protein [Nitrospirota bacterium]MBF0592875.1 ATP-binding protein [Nitrospirota bacterium]